MTMAWQRVAETQKRLVLEGLHAGTVDGIDVYSLPEVMLEGSNAVWAVVKDGLLCRGTQGALRTGLARIPNIVLVPEVAVLPVPLTADIDLVVGLVAITDVNYAG